MIGQRFLCDNNEYNVYVNRGISDFCVTIMNIMLMSIVPIVSCVNRGIIKSAPNEWNVSDGGLWLSSRQ